jgi:hypothetical protein
VEWLNLEGIGDKKKRFLCRSLKVCALFILYASAQEGRVFLFGKVVPTQLMRQVFLFIIFTI